MSKSITKIFNFFRSKPKKNVSLGSRVSSSYSEDTSLQAEPMNKEDSYDGSDENNDLKLLDDESPPLDSSQHLNIDEYDEINDKPTFFVHIWHASETNEKNKGYKHTIKQLLSTGIPGHVSLEFNLPDTPKNRKLASDLSEMGIYSQTQIGRVQAMKKGIPHAVQVSRIRLDFTFWPGAGGDKFHHHRNLEDDWKDESPYKRQYKAETGIAYSTISHETAGAKQLQQRLSHLTKLNRQLQTLIHNYENSKKIANRSDEPDDDSNKILKAGKAALIDYLNSNFINDEKAKKCKEDSDFLKKKSESIIKRLKRDISELKNTIRYTSISEGIPPSHTICLPISFDESENSLYRLDGNAMIEELKQLVENKSFKSFSNNCSRTSLRILIAGIGDDMKQAFSNLEGDNIGGKTIKIAPSFYKLDKIVTPTYLKNFSNRLASLITFANTKKPQDRHDHSI